MDKAKELLNKLGISPETVTALFDEDKSDAVNLDEVITNFKEGQKNLLKNDPEFINPLKKEAKGRELDIIEQKIKRAWNLDQETVKGKTFDEIVLIAKASSMDDNKDVNTDLQSQVVELNKKVNEYETEILPRVKTEAEDRYKTFIKTSKVKEIITGYDLTTPAEAVTPAIQNYLTDNFNIILEDGKIVLKTKDDLNPLDESGTKVLTVKDVINNKLSDFGVIRQSNATENGNVSISTDNKKYTTKQPMQNEKVEPKYKLPGLNKAVANVEALKKQRDFSTNKKALTNEG